MIQKYCSEKWDANAPLGGFHLKSHKKLGKVEDMESDERFMDGDRGSLKDVEHETGKDRGFYQNEDTNAEQLEKTRHDADARRLALLNKMRSTTGSNAFTETTSKARRKRRKLRDPDGVFADQDDMSNMDRPFFQRNLTKDEIDKILRENPEIAEEFDNERQRWLEFGEEDPNNINPLSDYNTLLVSKMQKGYDKKADDLIHNFRNKDFDKKLEKIEEERQKELEELEMDKLEMQGQAVAFSSSTGVIVRKKIKRKKKGKKKGKMFILDTPYGTAKFYKRRPSPPPVEDRNVMFQNQKNLDKKTKAKANKLHGAIKEESFDKRSGSSIVEGDEVMFETGFGPNKLIESDEDEFEEGDMVFYNKDDLTNYSKNLGLNKLKSRLSLMNFEQSSLRRSGAFSTEGIEDNEARLETTDRNSPGPKRKLIQKRTKKKRKTKSISSQHSFRKNNTISVRSAISSLGSAYSDEDSYNEYTSEEDNPNDRSGLLSFMPGRNERPNRPTKKGKIKKKNKWMSDKKLDLQKSGRKSFRVTGNLSLILPRYKRKMKRNRVVRKRQAPQKLELSTGSPYQEYLPARFKDIRIEDLNSSKLSHKNKGKNRDIKIEELSAAYVLSPSIPLTSARPPLSGNSANRHLNFYGKKSATPSKNDEVIKSATSLGVKSKIKHLDFGLQELDEEQEDNSSSAHNFDEMNHENVMFQRSHKVKPHAEDKAQKPTTEILFPMNKDFHRHTEKMFTVSSRGNSKDGSRGGNKSRTYTSEKEVISTIKLT